MQFEMIHLPMQEAIQLEAKQNFARDVEVGLLNANEWDAERELYEEEAQYLLEAFGQGYDPDVKGHVLVKVIA